MIVTKTQLIVSAASCAERLTGMLVDIVDRLTAVFAAGDGNKAN